MNVDVIEPAGGVEGRALGELRVAAGDGDRAELVGTATVGTHHSPNPITRRGPVGSVDDQPQVVRGHDDLAPELPAGLLDADRGVEAGHEVGERQLRDAGPGRHLARLAGAHVQVGGLPGRLLEARLGDEEVGTPGEVRDRWARPGVGRVGHRQRAGRDPHGVGLDGMPGAAEPQLEIADLLDQRVAPGCACP